MSTEAEKTTELFSKCFKTVVTQFFKIGECASEKCTKCVWDYLLDSDENCESDDVFFQAQIYCAEYCVKNTLEEIKYGIDKIIKSCCTKLLDAVIKQFTYAKFLSKACYSLKKLIPVIPVIPI